MHRLKEPTDTPNNKKIKKHIYTPLGMHMFNASTDTPNAGLISLMARVKSSIVILRFAPKVSKET